MKPLIRWVKGLFAILCLLLIFYACKKSNTPTIDQVALDKFFSASMNAIPEVQEVIKDLKQKESQYHFVDKIVKADGYPLWDNAKLVQTNRGTALFVPFNRQDEHIVGSVLQCSIGNVTAYRFLRMAEYKRYSLDKNRRGNLNDLLLLLMSFNNEVFGYSAFGVGDGRILQTGDLAGSHLNDSTKPFSVVIRKKRNSAVTARTGGYIMYSICYEVDVPNGWLEGVEPGGSVEYVHTEEQCTDYTIWLDDPTGSGGGGDTGGHRNRTVHY